MSGALDVVSQWPARAAAGVTSASGTLGTGGPEHDRFRWASVTKLVSALAVLVAVEEGSVTLDQPAGPPGATLRHLLAHTSGLPFEGNRPITAPGTRRIYSNTGIETAAAVVAKATGMDFADYVGAGVLDPLGMSATAFAASAAWGASGPLVDLLALGRQLLEPTLIGEATLAQATSVAFPGLRGLLPGFGRQSPNDWGLGFEIRDGKCPHWTGSRNSPATFGHFGRSGSFLWVDPEAGLACGALADRDFGPWAAEAWPRLSDAVIDEFGHPGVHPSAREPGA